MIRNRIGVRSPRRPRREGAPNVLYLVWDDTGIATWDCFGGLVEMPAMSRIAERGVRLSQFHTTALCSPTRASLLTGRNATTVGMAMIEEFTEGFPNSQRPHPVRNRFAPRGLGRAGLQHLLRRQVASDSTGRVESRRDETALADIARVRTLLRVHGWRDRPVVSGPGVRQPSGDPAGDARKMATTCRKTSRTRQSSSFAMPR